MNILRSVHRLLFGCRHTDLSRVFTIDHRSYQVCFECAEQIEYSWEQMHSVMLPASTNALQRQGGYIPELHLVASVFRFPGNVVGGLESMQKLKIPGSDHMTGPSCFASSNAAKR